MRKLAVWLILRMSAAAEVHQLHPISIEHIALEELQATKTPGAAVAVVSGDQVIGERGYRRSANARYAVPIRIRPRMRRTPTSATTT